jgi:hypothetical protein
LDSRKQAGALAPTPTDVVYRSRFDIAERGHHDCLQEKFPLRTAQINAKIIKVYVAETLSQYPANCNISAFGFSISHAPARPRRKQSRKPPGPGSLQNRGTFLSAQRTCDTRI